MYNTNKLVTLNLILRIAINLVLSLKAQIVICICMLLFILFVMICLFWYIQINLALFYSKDAVNYLFLFLAITQLGKTHIGIHQENK